MITEKDKHIIVNYHYVRDPDPKWRGIYPCPVNKFEKDVQFLSKHYQIVSVPEVYQTAKNGSEGKKCAITFDDGFLDNYENALPILKRYRILATFFIITSVLEGRVPATHKIHFLLSNFSASELIDMFNEWAAGRFIIPKDKNINTRRLHGDMLTNNFKETMTSIASEERDIFLNLALDRGGITEKNLNGALFMNPPQIRDLATNGMHIESHSHNHDSFETLDEVNAKKDIETSRSILQSVFGIPSTIFSFPHGRFSSATSDILKAEGFQYAVTIERRGIDKKDAPFTVPRYDVNDIL